jgi:hypothetical protein
MQRKVSEPSLDATIPDAIDRRSVAFSGNYFYSRQFGSAKYAAISTHDETNLYPDAMLSQQFEKSAAAAHFSSHALSKAKAMEPNPGGNFKKGFCVGRIPAD